MPLTEASPLLDLVESKLRKRKKEDQANELLKLQQDAGIKVAKLFGYYDPSAGPDTAKLDKAYEEITTERFNTVLQNAHAALPEGNLKIALLKLNNDLLLPETQPVAIKSKKLKM